MSYVDNGDDELDYEDEDYTEPGQGYGAHGAGAIAALAEDEMEEEEDYEDLYQDVDVNFGFENTEGVAGAGVGAQAAGPGAAVGGVGGGRYPNNNGVENGAEEDDYGEEEYAEEEYDERNGAGTGAPTGAGRAREIEEESYPPEEEEEEVQDYGDSREHPESDESVRNNARGKATSDGYDEQLRDYGEDDDPTAAADMALDQQHPQQQLGKEEDVGDMEDEEDIIMPEDEDLHEEEGISGGPVVGIVEAEAAAPSVGRSKQAEIVDGNNSRPLDYATRASTGLAGVGAGAIGKTEDRNYSQEDAPVGRGGGNIIALQKPKIEGEQQRTESQLGKSSAVVDRGGRKSATGWANGAAGPVSSEGGAGRGGGASGSWPAVPSSGGRGGSAGPLPSGGGAGMSELMAPNREAPSSTTTTAPDYMPNKHGGASHQHESGGIMLFVGELHWWTTDAELEAALSEYGRVKNLKFFEEKASGRSKGYCQVEFYEAGAARVCKEKMDGRVFNDRPCVVAFASPQTIKQMGAAQVGKNQIQSQHGQAGGPGRGRGGEPNSGGRGGPAGSQMGDGGRGYGGRDKLPMGGRGGGGGGGPEGRGRGPGRGRGGNIGGGRGGAGGAHFGQGPPGPMGGGPGGMMPPQGMMGGGFDPGFGPPMGGRGGYGMGPGGPGGGFGPRGPFGVGPGMGPPFPNMGPGLPGVAPHVNPAFFGRGNGNGPGIGMDGPAGGWGEGPMPGWVGDEHERRMVYGDEMGGPDYGYPGEMGPDRLRVGPPRERDRMVEGEWAGVDRRRREDRGDAEWAGERHRERGVREEYWDREQGREKEKDWAERERVPRGREKARGAAVDEEERPRSRDEDFSKRRRMVADRKIER
ncbi:unnamed protein product [Calypogeia fissa]